MADGIYFETESTIDGAPLVIIIRGAVAARRELRGGGNRGANAKTGAMVQSYILRRDIAPGEAARSGQDESVCGDCPHRPALVAGGNGEARCYVNLAHGPRVCFEAYKRGAYRRVTDLRQVAAYCAGLPLRIGSYGDPGAVFPAFWLAAASLASSRTGYTHRWRDTGRELQGLAMASVDSVAERDEALAAGWATFRVATTIEDAAARTRGEARCPASAEAGKRVTCSTCPLKCDGATGGRVILDHAAGGIGRKISKA